MAPDPIPEEELPPRLRFERAIKDEPQVFRSVRPHPDDDLAAEGGDRGDAADGPSEPADPDSHASILERFEALKRTLGQEIAPASPAPAPPAQPTPDDVPPAADGQGARPAAALPARPSSEHVAAADDHASPAHAEDPDGSFEALQARVRQMKRREQETSRAMEAAAPFQAEPEPATSDAPGLSYPELEGLNQAEAARRRREARKEKRRQRRKNRSFWQELPVLILVALVVAIIIKTFFFQAFYIPSGSMIPTLQINDRVLVNKLSYRFGAIERGDVLVFDSPEAVQADRSFVERVFRSVGEATGLISPDTVLIKRVIGLPGETVAVVDNQVYVNGNPIAEPYLPEGATMRDFEEIVVPADHVFMMGDNRNQSRDSRVFGAIPREDIVGRAFVSVWPPGAWGGL